METSIYFVVEAWVERYEYWTVTIVPSETLFGAPIVSYETEGEATERKAELVAKYPTGKYRIVRVTKTTEEIG